MESSYDEMMWGDWGFGSGVILYGLPKDVAIGVELVDICSM